MVSTTVETSAMFGLTSRILFSIKFCFHCRCGVGRFSARCGEEGGRELRLLTGMVRAFQLTRDLFYLDKTFNIAVLLSRSCSANVPDFEM